MKEIENDSSINLAALFLLPVFFLFSFQLFALDPNKPLYHYQLDEWQLSHGIPHNWISAIAQTPDGYLWVGTYSGLAKYDGARFEIIEKIENEDLTERSILSLYTDKQGTLWIGTRFGLVRYKDEAFKIFNKTDGMSSEDIDCIIEDMHSDLWIGTGDGDLNCLKNGKFTVFNRANRLGRRAVSSMLEDHRGNLWIGAYFGGLFKGQRGKFVQYDIKGLDNYSVFSLCQDSAGTLWVGTNRGLTGIKDKTVTHYTPADGLGNVNVPAIFEDSDGSLWVATGNGINRIRKKQPGKITFEHYLAGHIILCIFEDREKSLWIGTEDDGLKRLNDSTFKTLYREAGIPGSRTSLYETGNGDTWIGSHVGGLFKFKNGRANLLFRLGLSRDMGIHAVEQDLDDNLWLGTPRGLFMVKGKNTVKVTFNDSRGDHLLSNAIRVIYRDSRNVLWIGTANGLKSYYQGSFKTYTTADGLSDNQIRSIIEDRNHNLWIGTFNGIDILEKGKGNDGVQKRYLTGTIITGVYEDKTDNDVFWIGATYKGLVRLKNGHPVFYTKKHGFPSKFIFQILEDDYGNLWMSCDNGIIKANKGVLNEFAAGTIDKINCTLYGISDGMNTNQCSYGTRNSIIKTQSGEFWFSTRKGVAVVHPGKIKINKNPPPIVIKKVLFNFAPIAKNLSGSVFKGITDIRFNFTAPTFIAPEKIKFKYKLEGYDQDWTMINALQERTAVYKHLPFGFYSFKVSACNSDQIRNKNAASFEFTLGPYFYQTLLFKIAALLFVVFILAVFYYAYTRYRELKKLREKYKNSTLDRENAETYKKKLLYLLEVEKVYLDEEVSLKSLSTKLSISTRNLSQVINEQLNMNFCDMINVYRIEEAKRILSGAGQNDYSIMGIAFQVGFNSKASFYRAFRKHTGMTPSQYREKLKN